MLEQDTHIASAVKDNTHIFENKNDVLTEKHGMALCTWANSGDIASKKKALDKEIEAGKQKIKLNEEQEAKEMAENLAKERGQSETVKPKTTKGLQEELITLSKTLCDDGKSKEVVKILKLNKAMKPETIEDVELLEKVLTELKNL